MEIDQILTKRDLHEFEQRISSLFKSSQKSSKPPKYLRSKDVCEMLNISPATLQNLRNNGEISFRRLGGSLFYEVEEIESRLRFPITDQQ